MKIFNQSGSNILINSETVPDTESIIVKEMMFNTQTIYSDFGSAEIITEYGKRSFKCHKYLRAYDSPYITDASGMPAVIIVHTKPSNKKEELI